MATNAKTYNIIGYSICILLSIALGWVSTIGGSESDFVQKISFTTIPILLTLLVLYSTLTIHLINELKKLDTDKDLTPVVYALRRNIIQEIAIIVFLLSLLSIKALLIQSFPCLNIFLLITCNSIVVFSLLYFIWVIYDITMGLYDLVIKNINS